MSLVYDALKQHREPGATPAAALGSVLPVTEQPGRSRSFSLGNPAWLAISLLLAGFAGGSMYLFDSQRQPQPGDQKNTLPQAAPALAVTVPAAPGSETPAGDAALREQAPRSTLPMPDLPAVAASAGTPGMATHTSNPNPVKATAHQLAAASVYAPLGAPAPVNAGMEIQLRRATIRKASSRMPPQPLTGPQAHVVAAPDARPAAPAPTGSSTNQEAVHSGNMPAPVTVAGLAKDVLPGQPYAAATSVKPAAAISRKQVSPPADSGMAPHDAALVVSRFNDAVRGGEFATAQTLLDKVSAELGADSLVTLRLHGYLALKMGALQQAREDYQRIANSLQNDYEANRNLAVIDLQQGNQEQAKQRSKHMLEIYPDDPVFKVLAN